MSTYTYPEPFDVREARAERQSLWLQIHMAQKTRFIYEGLGGVEYVGVLTGDADAFGKDHFTVDLRVEYADNDRYTLRGDEMDDPYLRGVEVSKLMYANGMPVIL